MALARLSLVSDGISASSRASYGASIVIIASKFSMAYLKNVGSVFSWVSEAFWWKILLWFSNVRAVSTMAPALSSSS